MLDFDRQARKPGHTDRLTLIELPVPRCRPAFAMDEDVAPAVAPVLHRAGSADHFLRATDDLAPARTEGGADDHQDEGRARQREAADQRPGDAEFGRCLSAGVAADPGNLRGLHAAHRTTAEAVRARIFSGTTHRISGRLLQQVHRQDRLGPEQARRHVRDQLCAVGPYGSSRTGSRSLTRALGTKQTSGSPPDHYKPPRQIGEKRKRWTRD